MNDKLSEETPAQPLNTKVCINLKTRQPLELQQSSQPNIVPTEHSSQFSDLASAGRNLAVLLDDYLGGEETVVVAIFLVTVDRDERGFVYEAVFNYFK